VVSCLELAKLAPLTAASFEAFSLPLADMGQQDHMWKRCGHPFESFLFSDHFDQVCSRGRDKAFLVLMNGLI